MAGILSYQTLCDSPINTKLTLRDVESNTPTLKGRDVHSRISPNFPCTSSYGLLGLHQTLTDNHVSSEYSLFQRPHSSRSSAQDLEQSRSECTCRRLAYLPIRLSSRKPSSDDIERRVKTCGFIMNLLHCIFFISARRSWLHLPSPRKRCHSGQNKP